jgi:arylsulfatase A-like enzyme
MIGRTAVLSENEALGTSNAGVAANRLRFMSLLLLTAWCGLVAGLLEVGAVLIRKQWLDPDRLYKMSRHFVWLIPLSNLCVFLTLGLLGCGVILVWPRRGRWLFARGLCALVLLPAMLVAVPQIHGLAWLLVALGVAAQLVPRFERKRRVLWRFVLVAFPVAIAIVATLGASLWLDDRIKQASESARPAPPPGSPNVVLIVMDTVAAEHLSLHGYGRATSTTLSELAERGFWFIAARSASSWTLPSHATMFTGRWLHELSVGWGTPLDRTYPTLAEFLGARGYATAGFVANLSYCATDSGLARGFTQYHDFIFPEFTPLKMAVLVKRALGGFETIVYFTEDWLESAALLAHVQRVWRSLDTDRKGAAVVNREFLDWLSKRSQPERPFFAFMNYFDAHYPYQLLPGRYHRFGADPTDNYHRLLIRHWWELDKTTVAPEGVAFVTDAYDDCIADVDEQLGKLIDELDRRGVLKHTWLIITSDHGESFGEHAGIFCHGQSLYETELHVPLLVLPPGGSAKKQVVSEPVSLRDMAATVVDLAGLGDDGPFPGRSLARLWKQPIAVTSVQPTIASPSLAEVVPNDLRHHDSWGVPQQLPALAAVKGKDWSYIRREGNVRDELFHLPDDPNEAHNLADEPAAQTTVEQMRRTLDGLTGGRSPPSASTIDERACR